MFSTRQIEERYQNVLVSFPKRYRAFVLSFLTLLLVNIHFLKSRYIFPSPAAMSLTKLSLAENNLIIPAQEEFDQ
jgi:hypothetical protein